MSTNPTDRRSLLLRILAALLTLVFAIGAVGEKQQSDPQDDGFSAVVGHDTGGDPVQVSPQWTTNTWTMSLRERLPLVLRELSPERTHTSTAEVLHLAPKRPPPNA